MRNKKSYSKHTTLVIILIQLNDTCTCNNNIASSTYRNLQLLNS